jgi:plasmid stabilization system protein ParE
MKFKFHPEALAEYEDAARHYRECQRGLELRFIGCVESAIRQILQTPERWRVFEADIRRCLTKVFPYALRYTIEVDYILIIAVMHCHREPGYWLRRIGERERGVGGNAGQRQ